MLIPKRLMWFSVIALAVLAFIGIAHFRTAAKRASCFSLKKHVLYRHDHTADSPGSPGHPYHGRQISPEQVTGLLSDYNRRIAADPENGELISQKIHFALEYDLNSAVEECEKILRDNPDNDYVIFHLAVAYMLRGDHARAIHYAERCLKKKDTVDNRSLVAQIYYRHGNFEEAKKRYQEILLIDPEYKQAKQALEFIKQWQKIKQMEGQ